MSETIRFRLGSGRISFYDPINRVHLTKGKVTEAELSASVDLTCVRQALASGGLIELPPRSAKPTPQAEEVTIPTTEQGTAEPAESKRAARGTRKGK
jgi:hypothetical protein